VRLTFNCSRSSELNVRNGAKARPSSAFDFQPPQSSSRIDLTLLSHKTTKQQTNMSVKMSQHLLRTPALRQLPSRNALFSQCRRYATPASSDPPAPPLLLKLRTDLKSAMRAKDTPRLNVLRSLLAEVTNAAKSPSPVKTDMQLLSMLRKRQAAAKAASAEFKAAGREDLVEKEQGQVDILNEYAGGVETMTVEDVKAAIKSTIDELKAKTPDLKAGPVMKAIFAPGGSLDGKNVEKSMVPGIVKELLG
jgi:uncharacterized protein YqeY